MIKVSPKTKKTSFQVELPEADQVTLVGEFNGWNGEANPMRKLKSGVWKTDVKLDEGEYQFRYFVNNSYWLNDADSPAVPNDFGSENSVANVVIPAAKATAKKATKKTTRNGK